MEHILEIKGKLDGGLQTLLDVYKLIEDRLKLLEQRQNKIDEIELKMKENAEKAKSKIVLDIGGTRFTTSKSTLLAFEGSYFHAMLSSSHWQPDEDGSYFIDCNPKNFSLILDYMRKGEISVEGLSSNDIEDLKKDFDYFQIAIPKGIQSTVFDLLKKSSRAVISGNTFTISKSTPNASILGICNHEVGYWEVQVHSHLGAGHVCLGIASPKFDLESYAGSNSESIAISPSNVVCGFGCHNPSKTNNWEPNCVVGLLFDKKKGFLQFYLNKVFITQVKSIPQAHSWVPVFTVLCSEDKISLLPDSKFPLNYERN